MKVLLLSEFSGVYNNLYDGLRELGVDVTWASNGDVWKKIGGADIEVYPRGKNILEKAYNYLLFPLIDKRVQGYDVVQAITPMIYTWQINEAAMKRMVRNNGKFFINAAGADCFQYKAYLDGKYRYHIYDNNPGLIRTVDGKTLKSKCLNHAVKVLYSMADGIIPTVPYDYEVPFEGMKNLKKTILFPINFHKIEYQANTIRDKLVFYHGVSRPADKGSDHIVNAMKIIEERYPKTVECIAADRLPYAEYLKTISRANVIIDQCKGYGYGMNACISLAMGKVVMGGSEEAFKQAGNLPDCPIINIIPDTNQIVGEMERIIEMRDEMERLGEKGRAYIIKHHDYIEIAKQYVEEWNQ